jgi:hypothetical protein
MKKSVLLFFFFPCFVFGQKIPAQYQSHIRIADSLFITGDFKNASEEYNLAFKSFGGKGIVADRYHAAQSNARNGNKEAAFENLFRIAEKAQWSSYDSLMNDTSFVLLRSDTRWNKLVNKVRSNKAQEDFINLNH